MQSVHAWEKSLVQLESKIIEVLQNLEFTGLHVALVIDSNGKLVGTATDGDIRRAILKNIDLNAPVSKIMNSKPVTLPEKSSDKDILYTLKTHGIECVPLLDQESHPVALFTTGVSATSELKNALFILAGGKGTRLMPLTTKTPKPMLQLDGRPILEHILEGAKQAGFKKVVISLGYLGDKIKEYFGDGSMLDLEISYVEEMTPLGTAGPLGLLDSEFKNHDIVVTNGDVITDLSYTRLIDYHTKNNACATMVVKKYEIQNQFGVVEIEGSDITGIIEKPKYVSQINAGVYVLSPSVLKRISRNEYLDMTDLFEILISEKLKTCAFPMHEDWIDIGRVDDLEAARSNFSNNVDK